MDEILDGIESDTSSIGHKSNLSNQLIVDERILLGIDNLVNRVKVKTKEVTDNISDKNQNNMRKSATISPLLPSRNVHHTEKQQTPAPAQAHVQLSPSVDKISLAKHSVSEHQATDFNKPPLSPPIAFDSRQKQFAIHHSPRPNFIPHSPSSSRGSKKSKRSRASTPVDKEKLFEEKIELLTEWEELIKRIKRKEYKKLDINTPIEDIKYELKRLRNIRKKQKFADMMTSGFMAAARAVEWGCDKIEFIDIEMAGFANSLKHDDSVDEILLELYEKYKGTGKTLPPELRLIVWFLTSALTFAFMNKAPAMLAKFLNKEKGPNKKNKKKSGIAVGGYSEMTPPDIDDEELAELLYDNERLRTHIK